MGVFSPYFPFAGMETTCSFAHASPKHTAFLPTSPSRGWKLSYLPGFPGKLQLSDLLPLLGDENSSWPSQEKIS